MVRGFYKTYFLVSIAVSAILLINKYLFVDFWTDGLYMIFNKPGVFLVDNLGKAADFSAKVFYSSFQISKITAENEDLKTENLKLLSEVARLKKSEQENDLLRKQLTIPVEDQRQLLAAKVFSLNQNSAASTLLINKGTKDHAEKSMAVIAPGNVLIGALNRVFNDYSEVLLLDDPRSTASVKIGDAGIIANARGVGHGQVSLELVTNNESVSQNDLVVTSGLDNLPEVLLLGKISNVGLKGGNLFKTVTAGLFDYPVTNPNLFVILR